MLFKAKLMQLIQVNKNKQIDAFFYKKCRNYVIFPVSILIRGGRYYVSYVEKFRLLSDKVVEKRREVCYEKLSTSCNC